MLCAVISQVFSTRGPVEYELPLDHVVAQPVESHVYRLGAFGDNRVVGESHSGGIIGLDGLMSLRTFHFYENLAQGYHVLDGDKIAASPASAAEDMKNFIIWKMVIIDLLYLGLCSSLYRKMCAPAWVFSLDKFRCATSEWADRRMLLSL